MNKNKLILCVLIIVFLTGILLTPVTASHTYKIKGYKFTVSNTQYKQIQYAKKHKWDEDLKIYPDFKVKTNKYKKVKVKTYKKKRYIKYYQLYRNGKSLGDYCRSSTKISKRDMNIVQMDVGGRITQKVIYGYKKVKTYRYMKKRVYANINTYYSVSTGNKPQVQFVVMPTKHTWDWIYLTYYYYL